MHNVLKKAAMIFCVCLLILMLVTAICQGEPVTFVDDVGQEITVHEPVQKIISLEPDIVITRPFIRRSRPEFIAALERAGLQVVALYPESFER